MSAPAPYPRVRIGALTVEGASAIDARRLADALPAALERAFAGVQADRPSAADRAAAQILAAIEAAQGLERGA